MSLPNSRASIRSRSSIGNPSALSSLASPPQQPRASLTDLRRPPSSRSFRPASPRVNNNSNASIQSTYSTNSSRPGSAMSNRASFCSRPSTPSSATFKNFEPYTGSITVSIRPNPYSVNPSQPIAWEIEPRANAISNVNDGSSFVFDNVFPPSTSLSNKEVYHRSCAHIVDNFLNEGYNGTVFAYGMTGSGKTFSMRGDDRDPGFVKLAIDEIFRKVESDSDPTRKQYTITLTYLEIYNEKIIDLLSESSSSVSQDLKIRDDPIYGTKIVGITSPIINSKDQILDLIRIGDNKRKTSATDFNARSSRSHSILQVKLNTIDVVSKTEQHATLSLCDLAGSERATSSVERRKEGAYINKSLLALSTVINKLSLSTSYGGSSPSALGEHIPYRDSKLTRLLQPALSGSSLVSILCTVHLGSTQSASNQQFVSETYNTLRFAARAKDIVIHVNTNKKTAVGDPDTLRMIEELKSIIESQKSELQLLKSHGGDKGLISMSSTSSNGNYMNDLGSQSTEKDIKIAQLEAEIKILNEKLEHLVRLTDLQKTETVLLRNDALNDLLGIGITNNTSQIMMSNLEDFYKRINYEMDEHKSYITHLENQLRLAHEQLALTTNADSTSSTTVLATPIASTSSSTFDYPNLNNKLFANTANSSAATSGSFNGTANDLSRNSSISRNSSVSSNSSSRFAQRKLSNEGRIYSDRQIEMKMKDQEEEIWHLKEMLKDKDHIINGLTKTSKLRRLVDSSTINSPYMTADSLTRKSSLRLGAVTPPLTAKSDKENIASLRNTKSKSIDVPDHSSMNFMI